VRVCKPLLVALLAAAISAPSTVDAGGAGKVRHHEQVGRSARGRPIVVSELGNPDARESVLVVGCIHGNECAGLRIADVLTHGALPATFDLFVLRNLNPDGSALGTRQNANGVDLNRNFPWGWHRSGSPGDTFYSGPRPASAPETKVAMRFILAHPPDVTLWFHQHMDLVWASGGSFGIQRCYARLAGIRFARLRAIGGSASDWINHRFSGATSTVVELPAGRLSAREAVRYATAVRKLARWNARSPRGPCPA